MLRVGGRVGGTGRLTYIYTIDGLPYMGSAGKESACNAGEVGSIPGLGRSPGGGNDYPLQYSGLVNPMDRGAWQVTAAKSQTRLCDFHFHSIDTVCKTDH